MIARGYGFLTLIMAVMAVGFAAPPRGLEGFWQGAFKVQSFSLRLAFKIRPGMDGGLTGTLDSIDQGAKEIPLSEVRLEDRSVRFQVKSIAGVFEGTLSEGGDRITGEWKQGGATFPLALERVEKVVELKRPQEPIKPYPYNEEEVAYENTSGGGKIAGTLTWPRAGGPYPAVLLRAIRKALREGGNRDVTTKSFPELNHLFQTSRTGSPAEYGEIEETFAPAALTFIGDWIARRTGGRR